ncbi:hypothetical protein OIU34_16630 [Pararhizobium sp. BT-229]|uniref:hypothetical protein n=1 Tax=Pararhizobium sp. BT-229 TaxID=2986923 RepID=UPI0021F6ADDA|nr:hypothetical protein [Pararhizobium sp. BT-229]MCV9963530.1 hypothetical protein [Pararhizobium sp. BT-229]
MALRKRSYKWGSDKWLGVAFHNARVDAHRDRKARDDRNRRLDAIRTKLRGEGIDGSWADDALRIMETYGYGLNQFSTRVVPELRQVMRQVALDERRKAEEGEQRRIDAERRKADVEETKRRRALAAEQRQQQLRAAREERKAEAAKRKQDNAATRAMATVGDEKRRQAGTELKQAIQVNRQLSPGAADTTALADRAMSSTADRVSREADEIVSTIENPLFSFNGVVGAVNRSMYFDYGNRGLASTAAILLGDVALAVVVFLVVAITDKSLGTETASFSLFVAMIFALPPLLVWHYIRLRRRRISLALPWVVTTFKTEFLGLADSRVKPPGLRRKDIPRDLSTKVEAINSGFREAAKRPWA